jgi:hypothetical protein
MDVRSFFSCPTAVKTETIKTKTKTIKTETETKTYPMSLTTEKIVEHMCKTNKWVLRNGPRHNWFVIKGKTLYIDEKEGCRIVCANKAFEARVSQAFKVAWDDLTPPDEEEDEMKECEICHEKWLPEETTGCCNDGDCPHHIETMCAKCGVWSEEEGVWRCDKCAEEDAMTYGEREEDEPEECNQCNVELDKTTGREWIEELGCLCKRCYDLRKGDFPDGV